MVPIIIHPFSTHKLPNNEESADNFLCLGVYIILSDRAASVSTEQLCGDPSQPVQTYNKSHDSYATGRKLWFLKL